jgi:hypothetical protein
MAHPTGDEPLDRVRVQDNFDVQRQPFSERPSRETGKHPNDANSCRTLVNG